MQDAPESRRPSSRASTISASTQPVAPRVGEVAPGGLAGRLGRGGEHARAHLDPRGDAQQRHSTPDRVGDVASRAVAAREQDQVDAAPRQLLRRGGGVGGARRSCGAAPEGRRSEVRRGTPPRRPSRRRGQQTHRRHGAREPGQRAQRTRGGDRGSPRPPGPAPRPRRRRSP